MRRSKHHHTIHTTRLVRSFTLSRSFTLARAAVWLRLPLPLHLRHAAATALLGQPCWPRLGTRRFQSLTFVPLPHIGRLRLASCSNFSGGAGRRTGCRHRQAASRTRPPSTTGLRPGPQHHQIGTMLTHQTVRSPSNGDTKPRAITPRPSQTQPHSPRPIHARFASLGRRSWSSKVWSLGIGARGFSFSRCACGQRSPLPAAKTLRRGL